MSAQQAAAAVVHYEIPKITYSASEVEPPSL